MPRPLKKRTRQEILKIIATIRGRNNREWIQLWDIALCTRKGRKIFDRIGKNDHDISVWMGRLLKKGRQAPV